MALYPNYVTDAELKEFVRVEDPADTADDTEISIAATVASRIVDARCGRQFGALTVAAERHYKLKSGIGWTSYADIFDLGSVADLTVEVDGVTLSSDDYELEDLNALADGQPYTRITVCRRGLRAAISGRWGWSHMPEDTYPDVVVQATKLQGSRLLARRDAPLAMPAPGTELRLLDPAVAVMLRPPYRLLGSVR